LTEASRVQLTDAVPIWFDGGNAAPPLNLAATLPGEAEESRRQLSSVLKCLSGLFYRCELQAPWAMSFISEGIEDLTGYSARDIQRMNGWDQIIAPQDRPVVEAHVAIAIRERQFFDLTFQIQHADGTLRWVSERGHAVYDDAGTPLFLEGIITDVSGRKQAEDLQRTLASRWRKTLDSIPQMVWTMAGDGSEEFYNSRWLAFTGLDVGADAQISRLELVLCRTGRRWPSRPLVRHLHGHSRSVRSPGSAENQ
jgi:PAS domain S-box-containing protein